MTDRLPREDWAHLVEQVPPGGRRRFRHLCGAGSPLLVSRDPDGARAYCFRCDASGWAPPQQQSLAQVLAARREAAEADEATGSPGHVLPAPLLLADRLPEWPEAGRLWLARAGMGAYEIAALGAGYHPPTNRVVLPVMGPDGPVYWQARSIDGRMPKYLGASSGREQALPRWGNGKIIAVTEDILSAFKIGLSGGEAWCALGVRLSPKFLAALLAAGKPVAVWLDPDPAGQAGAAKIARTLRAWEIPHVNIVSRCDPKLMQRKEIHARLEQAQQG